MKKQNSNIEEKLIVAKKDHVLFQNKFFLAIKKGDKLDKKKIPEHLWEALKTEKVID